jgi:trk system potassium uptake protein TrkH
MFMLAAMIISFFSEGDDAFYAFLLSFFISATVGVFPLIFTPVDSHIGIKEVYAVVLVSWAAICLFGTLPYVLWGDEFSVVNAWFESVSGYTTTGATILRDIEALPRSILFFRSCTHWMGGVGVVLFALLLAPAMKLNKMRLSKMEMSSLANENFRYKTQETIHIILTVYILGTALCFLMLKIAGMSWFDAINHAFSTFSTGGFSTKNDSMASFTPQMLVIVMFFMLMSGIHFGLLYAAVTRRSNALFRSPTVHYYIKSLFAGIVLIALGLWIAGVFSSLGESLLHGAFQVISYATTTGYSTVNSAIWPSFAILLLVFFMLQSGCAGSTTGGIKVDRLLVFFKSINVQIKKQQHPNAIVPVKIGNSVIDDEVSHSITLFMLFFLLIAFISTFLLSLTGIDLMSAFSASLASLTNAGQGFGVFGSMGHYDVLHPLGKLLLTLLMISGRLEIYGLLLLFFIKSWR